MQRPQRRPVLRLHTHLSDLDDLMRLIDAGGAHVQARVACTVDCGAARFDVPVVTLGSHDLTHPAVAFVGGVHGLERIGSQVVMTLLRTLLERLKWDALLHRQLDTLRMVFMPLVNPGGLWLGTRANPQGVDLMRNAPLEAEEPVPFLIGGQRLSALLPWYRGPAGAPCSRKARRCATPSNGSCCHARSASLSTATPASACRIACGSPTPTRPAPAPSGRTACAAVHSG